MSVASVRDTIYATLATVDGLSVYRRPPARPNLPSVVVHWPPKTEHQTTSGGSQYIIPVLLYLSRTDWENADLAAETFADAIIAAFDDPDNGPLGMWADLDGNIEESLIGDVECFVVPLTVIALT